MDLPNIVYLVMSTFYGYLVYATVYLFGGENIERVGVLVTVIILDCITGLCASWISRGGLSSRRGYDGIKRKIVMLCMVCLGHFIDLTLGVNIVQITLIYMYIGTEGISITENATECGVPVPKFILNHLEVLKDKGVK